jgi:putative ABC transport system ATP-binding protein
MMSASAPVLASVTGLTYRYAPQEPDVLRDVSLTIGAGEIVALTGPSGSGKTTLLSLLGMMRRVEPSRIHLFDTDIGSASAGDITELRRRVRFIFQKHYLLRSLTAQQNVIAGAVLNPRTDRRMSEEQALTLLAAFGLGDDGDKWPDQLSVGQQQRVAVARSLINQPELLLADEPTASLDRGSARLVTDRIFEAARTLQCGVLISTHDEAIMASATRCLQLRNGLLSPIDA